MATGRLNSFGALVAAVANVDETFRGKKHHCVSHGVVLIARVQKLPPHVVERVGAAPVVGDRFVGEELPVDQEEVLSLFLDLGSCGGPKD